MADVFADSTDVFINREYMERVLRELVGKPRATHDLQLVDFQYVELRGGNLFCLPYDASLVLARQSDDDVSARGYTPLGGPPDGFG